MLHKKKKKILGLRYPLGTLAGGMSSHSFDRVKIFPVAEDSSSSVDLERLAQEISLATSEHVLSSRE